MDGNQEWVLMFKVLSLFAGLGGFDLGLERTGGFETVAFCEIDPFCQHILVKHWPEVPCYDDIRNLTADRLVSDGIIVDIICGGFPCQNVSLAGDGKGLAGDQSGLWSEYARLIGELRPKFVIVENVAALLGRGLADVLGDLATLGYDAEWHCIPASSVGLAQERDRVWIIAHLDGERVSRFLTSADIGAARQGWQGCQEDLQSIYSAPFEQRDSRPQPLLRRMDDRPANWVDRLHACGNAVVPQIAEMIGHAILASENARW